MIFFCYFPHKYVRGLSMIHMRLENIEYQRDTPFNCTRALRQKVIKKILIVLRISASSGQSSP